MSDLKAYRHEFPGPYTPPLGETEKAPSALQPTDVAQLLQWCATQCDNPTSVRAKRVKVCVRKCKAPEPSQKSTDPPKQVTSQSVRARPAPSSQPSHPSSEDHRHWFKFT